VTHQSVMKAMTATAVHLEADTGPQIFGYDFDFCEIYPYIMEYPKHVPISIRVQYKDELQSMTV